jgi:signal transduction histidine kinase
MSGSTIFLGYAYIENSPYILMLVRKSEEIMKGWNRIRQEINWVFGISVMVTLIFVFGISVFMVNRIYDADKNRRKAMESLERSSRLISVGRLAAGVAHEINNPLAIINESAGLIKDKFNIKKEYKEDRRLVELIDDVLESVERCGEITKQLLGFAREFDPKIEPLRFNSILSQVLSFFRKEASYRNISINKDIPEDLPLIHSDRGSLQQVFFNLINNAIQAMTNENSRLDVTAVRKDDETITVTIKDNGGGISEEDQKRIFEPFFTTKNLEGGTGLGLAITYGIIKKLHGDISFRSKIGKGTEFTVTLPIKYEGEI